VLAGSRDFIETHTWIAGENPVDLTGCAAHLLVGSGSDPSNRVVAISTTARAEGAITLGRGAGTVRLQLTTAAIQWLRSMASPTFALHVTFPSGIVVKLLQGNVSFHENGSL
jgi:hypothetical protein